MQCLTPKKLTTTPLSKKEGMWAGILIWVLLCINYAPFATAEQAGTERIAAAFSGLLNMRGQFEQQRLLVDIPQPIVSRGVFIYRRNRGLYWETNEPFFNASTFTPEGILHWQERGVAARSNLKNPRVEQAVSRVLLSVFSADLARIKEQFSVSVKPFAASGWSLTLKPSSVAVKQAIDTITLVGHKTIHTISIASASGDKTRITLTNTDSTTPLSAQECGFFSVTEPRNRQGEDVCR
ncbi:MAG: outer membrane lipoprotein carrier protein LolA [Exilibacterium sp.]